MAASTLDRFSLFMQHTREKVRSTPESIVAQSTKYRTHMIRRILAGRGAEEFVQAGKKIIDFAMLRYTNTFQAIDPEGQMQYSGVGAMDQLEVPWRFYAATDRISEVELDLQESTEAQVFKKVKKIKDANLFQSQWEGMEEKLLADPNYEQMEGPSLGGGKGEALSLRCFITRAGGTPQTADGPVAGSTAAWPTVMTVASATRPAWSNQVVAFNNTDATTRAATFIPALDRLWLKVQFESPATSQEYITDTRLNRMMLVSNLATQAMLVQLATSKNNVLTPRNDIGWASGQVVYHGIPTKYIGILDNIDTGNDTGATNKYTIRAVNLNHFKIIVHRKHNRNLRILPVGASMPYVRVMFQDTWYNLWCSNRREQGIMNAGTAEA